MKSEVSSCFAFFFSSFFLYLVDVAAFFFLNAAHTNTVVMKTGGGAHATCYANQKVSISNVSRRSGHVPFEKRPGYK